jgi:hypothetical protein
VAGIRGLYRIRGQDADGVYAQIFESFRVFNWQNDSFHSSVYGCGTSLPRSPATGFLCRTSNRFTENSFRWNSSPGHSFAKRQAGKSCSYSAFHLLFSPGLLLTGARISRRNCSWLHRTPLGAVRLSDDGEYAQAAPILESAVSQAAQENKQMERLIAASAESTISRSLVDVSAFGAAR